MSDALDAAARFLEDAQLLVRGRQARDVLDGYRELDALGRRAIIRTVPIGAVRWPVLIVATERDAIVDQVRRLLRREGRFESPRPRAVGSTH